MDKSQIKYIRVEIPCELHYKFTQSIIKTYGTSKAQNEAFTAIISDYINSNKPIKVSCLSIKKNGPSRVISQPLTARMKERLKEKARKETSEKNYLQKVVISIIENYVND